ncbi:MAG: hypothetical protein MZV70_70750 [Desulfobacterales bacterium]|nr:hypothetical protein [Desulfobacterales bacterium]
MVNILAPECTDREIGEMAAAVERKIPGAGTVRPKGMRRLPREGMIAASGRFIKGAVAAANESPFLEGQFWGFGEAGAGRGRRGGLHREVRRGARRLEARPRRIRGDPPGRLSRRRRPGLVPSIISGTSGAKAASSKAGTTPDAGSSSPRRGAAAAFVLGDPDGATARARLETVLTP